ncbi:MAG: SDR family NAD(P)-dependent oxidoreductase [Atopobiaceae bacterium]|jgi:3-oxoacyl-[acyl-carrier protein] reductase|nr:SDR family oxidoreductase [Atopobiaceae bacterium]MCH4181109.1 SDR family oxidoreductase [Atopobiaceae bacterium]MCH4214092.1 SDR family oxidoreductase [Atopobiaceae bacterium]MCH4276444.1 SDR family oxidoreductase [Atopobiaceae bacterium]MCI1226246.1 SDR family oxidoreductase [Atopobiaceae bacterium]
MATGKYDGYKVMIAGSTSGIGLSITEMFLREGATVLGLGRNFENVQHLGDRYIPFKCDVTDLDQIRAACDKVRELFDGHLDVFINSAGVGVHYSVKEVTSEKFDFAVDLLLKSSVMFTRYCYEYLEQAEHGSPVIIHVSSIGARTIEPGDILYGICKTGMNLYSKQSAGGLPGVRVMSLSPGPFITPIFAKSRTPEETEQVIKYMGTLIPSGRMAEPDEIGDLVSFLCSDEASYINGCDISIDGGTLTRLS